MRLGGLILDKYEDPDGWVAAIKRYGYTAAFFPIDADQGDDLARAYADAARAANIVIAEVGAWSSPVSADEAVRQAAIKKCEDQLALADRIGANCCVNISGSRGESWAGPHPDNLTDETFDLIVETVRDIIDAVKPTRTFYTLETMPSMFPDSADSYLRLIKAIDRERFAAHFDPINLMASHRAYYNNAVMVREFFEKLGPYIKSCHAKDAILHDEFTVHIDQTRPGLGGLDFGVYLTEIDKLGPDTPLMLEYQQSPVEYVVAAAYIRAVAKDVGVTIVN